MIYDLLTKNGSDIPEAFDDDAFVNKLRILIEIPTVVLAKMIGE